MPTTAEPEAYLSLSELARKAGISYPTALKLVADEILVPDATAGRMGLYKATRWDELRQTIRKNVIHYHGGSRFVFDPAHPLNLQ